MTTMSSITMMDIRLALEDQNLEGFVGEKRRYKTTIRPSLGFENFELNKSTLSLFFSCRGCVCPWLFGQISKCLPATRFLPVCYFLLANRVSIPTAVKICRKISRFTFMCINIVKGRKWATLHYFLPKMRLPLSTISNGRKIKNSRRKQSGTASAP